MIYTFWCAKDEKVPCTFQVSRDLQKARKNFILDMASRFVYRFLMYVHIERKLWQLCYPLADTFGSLSKVKRKRGESVCERKWEK